MILLLFQCKNSSLAADLCEQEKKKDEDRVETSQKAGRETHILLYVVENYCFHIAKGQQEEEDGKTLGCDK